MSLNRRVIVELPLSRFSGVRMGCMGGTKPVFDDLWHSIAMNIGQLARYEHVLYH